MRLPSTSSPHTSRRAGWTDLIILLALAAAFRIPALTVDFWFDEIFSYEHFAARASSLVDIFLSPAFKHDNNHHLNTITLYLLGARPNWVAYRLPGALAGLAAVAGAMHIGMRHGRLTGWLSGLAVGVSFLPVVYSSEARGYAWLMPLALGAFLALDRYLEVRSRGWLLAFWGAIAAGLAAHPAILHVYLGALVWSGFRCRTAPRELVRLHAVPILTILLWVGLIVRGAIVGGGPPWTWAEILDDSLAWTLGFPRQILPPLVVAGAAAALVLWDARALRTRDSDEGVFYVAAIFGPFVLMAALSPPYLFPRYFLVPLLFLLLVAARSLARLASSSRPGRVAAGIAAVLFVAGNAHHLAGMVHERRGNHADALRLMARSANQEPVSVSSWSIDQWTEGPLRFYSPRLGLADRLAYVPRELALQETAVPVTWMTEVRPACEAAPDTERRLPSGARYVLVSSFPVCGPSGMSWYLYARSGP